MASVSAEERIEQINSIETIMFLSFSGDYHDQNSRVTVKCLIDGYIWESSIKQLLSRRRCPKCSGSARITEREMIDKIGENKNIKFIRWNGEYSGARTGVIVYCIKHNFQWKTSAGNIYYRKTGCPQCSGVRRWTAEERIEQINGLGSFLFVAWDGGYSGKDSKAVVRCVRDGHEWSARVNELVNRSGGCPSCAKYGYSPQLRGYLYALRSECGQHVKVGISNKPSQRYNQLEKATPFKFSIIEQIDYEGSKIASLEKYFHNKYKSSCFYGFDGATEWLLCTEELLDEIRNARDLLNQDV